MKGACQKFNRRESVCDDTTADQFCETPVVATAADVPIVQLDGDVVRWRASAHGSCKEHLNSTARAVVPSPQLQPAKRSSKPILTSQTYILSSRPRIEMAMWWN